MTDLQRSISFIGFGEAAIAFAAGLDAVATGYDRKLDDPALAAAKERDFMAAGVRSVASNAEAVAGAPLILSLATADQALAAAEETAASIAAGALYCDMNSVAPQTKQRARDMVEAAGGRYVDVAVMAPVHPARRAVPMLASGPHAAVAVRRLAALGFRPRALDAAVGAASTIKMARSVMIKGLEALTVECMLAAEAAGVRDEVFESLNAAWPGVDWIARTDYNLDRMMVHGVRRAAEMEEAVATLDALGAGSAMTRGTVERQRAIGVLGLDPPLVLADKLALVLKHMAAAV